GRCIDLWTVEGTVGALFAWIDRAGRALGLTRPMPGRDPAHVATVGDWRAIANRLRLERLTGAIVASVRAIAGGDVVAGLTELATPAPEISVTSAAEATMAMASDPAARRRPSSRLTIRRYGERKSGRHAHLSCSRPVCPEHAS